jgi:hypothetical protein
MSSPVLTMGHPDHNFRHFEILVMLSTVENKTGSVNRYL